MKKTLYEKKLVAIDETMKPIRRVSHIYSYLRLACVIVAIVIAIVADQTEKSILFYLSGVSLFLFGLLVFKHSKVKQELRQYEAHKDILHHILARFDDTWKQESYESSADKEDTVSIDLDIVGERSLYQYLSVATTPFGEEVLTSLLKGDKDDIESIYKRQNACKELLQKEEILEGVQTSSRLFAQDKMKLDRETFDFLIAYGTQKTTLFPSWIHALSWVMVILTWICLLLGVLKIIPYGYVAVCILANIILSFILSGPVGNALAFTKNLERILKDYQVMFEVISKEHFDDEYLQSLQMNMKQGMVGISKLVKVMNMVAMRHNLLSYLILGSLLQLDVRCIHSLERWRIQYGVDLEAWLYSVGEIEALASLCVLGQVKETITFPEVFQSDTPIYQLEDGVHPLIIEKQAVANSISLHAGSIIVTGSNMSGKTTFFRTLGLQMMLLRAGAPVCAKVMKASVLCVHTSMRVRDDVSEGISTFYAEILRIRRMMEDSKLKTPMLILIDEIFKGTNSADRIMCAKTAIRKLHLPWVITMVSTHDFELCDLEAETDIQALNYHFSEYYENDEIHFDYTLKDGRCTTTNAQYLMKLAGF